MKPLFWRHRPDKWLTRVCQRYRAYQRPPNAYGMSTDFELCLLETYAREVFKGKGKIVDLGCWYGATTLCLARGLAANTRAVGYRTIEALDLFEWESWMDPIAQELCLPRQYEPSQSFYEDVKNLLSPYCPMVNVQRQNLLQYQPPPEPIEMLFIDAMKTWELAAKIITCFFPLLMKRKSYVIQQDFAFYHSVVATNHLLMWRLRDYLQCVHHVPCSPGVVFFCVKPLHPSELPPLTPDSFTAEMVDEAYEYCRACVSSDTHIMLEVAKLGFLLERGHVQAAYRQMKKLDAAPSDDLSDEMLEEVRRMVQQCPAPRTGPEGTEAASWLGEIDAWSLALSPHTPLSGGSVRGEGGALGGEGDY